MTDVVARTDIEVVEAFLHALEALDVAAAMDLATDDIEYQNVPFPSAKGKRSVGKQLGSLNTMFTGFEAHNHHIASDGDGVVLTERTDVLIRGRIRASFWVCGTFEVRDGKVAVWRDRFDFVDFTVACVKALVLAPFRGR